nr:WP=heat-stable wheat protein {N-terminal} [Triticum aestivum=wheat, Peptide Partial, 37 aa] [Triticum aestivum]
VGGGRRGGAADEAKLNTGVFAALTLKKKKKGDKAKGG